MLTGSAGATRFGISTRSCRVLMRRGRSDTRDGRPTLVASQSYSPIRHFRRGRSDVSTATKVVLKPLEDRIVVEPLEAEQVTASGLVIPDTAKEKPQEGKVLAVGP